MFDIEKIKKLNETEFQIYNFLMDHVAEVSKMTIRELAQMTHVSAATSLDFVGIWDLRVFQNSNST